MNWIKKLLWAVAVLVTVAVLVLLGAGMRSSAGEMDVAVDLNRPAAVVFPWLAEGDKLKQWVSWLKDVRTVAPGQNGVGVKQVWVMEDRNNNNAPMEILSESTVYDPPRRLAAKLSVKDSFSGVASYELTEQGGRTTVRSRGRFAYHEWFARLLEPVITPAANKKQAGDFATLKRLVGAAN